jgi:hypothetical protein
MHWKVLAPLHFVTYACGCGARLPCIPGCVHVMLVQKVSWCMQRLHLQVILLLCLESAILLPLNYIRATGAHRPRQNGEPRQPRHLDTSDTSTALTQTSTYLDTRPTWGLAPIRCKKNMCFLVNSQSLAAPASRRLGRAGLEAPPLRGLKILSFLDTLERHFPLKITVSHTSLSQQSNTQKCTVHKGKVKTPPKARTQYSPFLSAPAAWSNDDII